MGTHRSGSGSRGLARWVIAAIVAVLVVAGVAAGMVWLSGQSDQEGRDAAGSCIEGDLALRIAVAPALVEPLRRVAEGFNTSGTVSSDYCPKAEIIGIESPAALAALAGKWDPASGAAPALWIPESTTWTARLAAAKPAEVSGQPSSIASSPVVLAVRRSARDRFDGVRWLDLPARQADLKIALPTGGGADGTYLAAQSVAAAVARTNGARITEAAARTPLVVGTLDRWAATAPRSADTAAALQALMVPSDSLRAVPVIEQQLFAFAAGRDTAVPVAVSPSGPTAAATYPAAVLDRPDVSDAQRRAAADFVAYLSKGENAKPLAEAGFRVPGLPTPGKTATVSFGTVEPLAASPNPAIIAIADAITAK